LTVTQENFVIKINNGTAIHEGTGVELEGFEPGLQRDRRKNTSSVSGDRREELGGKRAGD